MANIRLSLTFARWVLETSKQLIHHVYGQNYDPTLGEFDQLQHPANPTLYFRMTQNDHEAAYWLNTCIQFLKTISGIFAHEIGVNEVRPLLAFYDEPPEPTPHDSI